MSLAVQKGNTLIYKGSNYLKQRLVLSVLSGKSIKITEIRTLEDEPGLTKYEVSLIHLLNKISNGQVVELDDTGTSLYFQPGLLCGGNVQHNCSVQRGIGYYLEALCMLAFFCKQPLNVTLNGVTNNNLDPSVDLLKTSLLAVIKRFIVDDERLEIKIKKRGVLPLGGGEVVFKCPIRTKLRPIQLIDNGMVKRVRGTAYALRVSPAMANRMVEKAKGVLLKFLPDVYISTDQLKGTSAGRSPGFGLHLYAETTQGVIYSAEQISNDVSTNGTEPSVPEDLGIAAAQRLLYEIFLGGVTDSSTQSLAILNMALGPKDVSKLVLGPLTDYSVGLLRNLKEFFGVTFKIEHFDNDSDDREGVGGKKVLLTCVGIGFSNISKRAI